jgi:hypothetical protein
MRTEDTPDRLPEKPQADHHFETPVVREAPPAGAATRDDTASDAGSGSGSGSDSDSSGTTTRRSERVRCRAN